ISGACLSVDDPLPRSGGGGPASAGGGGGCAHDLFDDRCRTEVKFFGGDAQHADALFAQPGVAAGVVLGLFGMHRAVDLDAELCPGAVEIEDVGAEGVL